LEKIEVVDTGDKPFRKFVTLEEDGQLHRIIPYKGFPSRLPAFLLNLPGRREDGKEILFN
jgi:hypothetical protein